VRVILTSGSVFAILLTEGHSSTFSVQHQEMLSVVILDVTDAWQAAGQGAFKVCA